MSREGAERRPLSFECKGSFLSASGPVPFKPCGRRADRNRMASQLRLHVLLPLALLGLIGAAFGVYTMGKAPGGGGDAGVPLITTHPDKAKPKPAATSEEWVKSLEAWCGGVQTQFEKVEEPTTLADYESAIGESVEIWDSAQPAFIKLGLPSQKKATAIALRKNFDRQASVLRSMFNRFQALDVKAIQNRLDEVDDLDQESDALLRQLGAEECLDEKNKGVARLAIQEAPLLINSQLQRYGKVVVLFYEPGATYDSIQTREARAGALLAHAGFVSVNVSKNREVGQLASQYNVLQSPTVLIFTRGHNLKARIDGFYDRTAIVQAVKNA
jgi:hypothetical protein